MKRRDRGTATAQRCDAAQLPLPFQLVEHSTFDRFVVGGNAELIDRLRRRRAQFGCLWLFGGAGVGKTHLLQAVCHSRARSIYVPAGERAAAEASLSACADFENVAIDDVPRWLAGRAAEVELFDLYNRLRASGGELLLTADRPPHQIAFSLPDLASRFGAATCYEVAPLRDDGRAQLLGNAARRRGLLLSDEVVNFLLSHVGRDQRHLLGILDRLDRSSLAAQRRITIPFVKDVLCI